MDRCKRCNTTLSSIDYDYNKGYCDQCAKELKRKNLHPDSKSTSSYNDYYYEYIYKSHYDGDCL